MLMYRPFFFFFFFARRPSDLSDLAVFVAKGVEAKVVVVGVTDNRIDFGPFRSASFSFNESIPGEPRCARSEH